ncbi:hypothetical protein [Hymenobacter sp. B1770]|uniref:hypothetical protein n=1 Tax=Hymenobacter sp. B1770 TaxID=1718788 RepID=UPI003CF8C1C1
MLLHSTPRLYFENATGRLFEHPDGFVILQYKAGKRQFTELKALLTHTGNLLQRNHCNRLLGDQRLMTPYTEEESAWIVNYWLDSSRQAPGGIFGAVLLANDVFARLSNAQVMHDAKAAALTYRHFDKEENAMAWLRELS